MNRFQYDNAVTDLFEMRCLVFTLPERMMRVHSDYFKPETGKMADVVKVGSRPLGKSQMIERRLGGVAAFPQDLRAEHGFDNRGDHLSLSPLLMESFLALGQSITQSSDFQPANVGIWKRFFLAPAKDTDPASEGETAETIGGYELATRLSFFLWGSLPDQTLLELAGSGELKKPEVLNEQIDRMLKDRSAPNRSHVEPGLRASFSTSRLSHLRPTCRHLTRSHPRERKT